MRIDKLQADLVRNEAKSEVDSASKADAVKQAAAPVEAQRVDRVEISDAGRALAEVAGAPDGDSLPMERLTALRELVVGGKYDTPEVIAEVARKMSGSGDLYSIMGE